MKEIWRKIDGWPEYEISNLGHVKSVKRKVRVIRNGEESTRTVNERILKEYVDFRGRSRVDLQHTGEKKAFAVSVLVAITFIPNPNKFPLVLHSDDDPSNNLVNNLRWGTHQDNMNDRHVRNRTSKGVDRPAAKLVNDDIPKIRKLLRMGLNCEEIGRQFGVTGAAISSIKLCKTWNHIK